MLIALTGKRKAGKDTVAGLIQELEPSIQTFSFAAALKDAYAAEFRVDRCLLDDPLEKEKYRRGLQQLSEVWKEKFGEDIFAQMVADEVSVLSCPTMITDLRFFIELETIRWMKPIILHVSAPDYLRRKRGWVPGEVDKHSSETEMAEAPPAKLKELKVYHVYNRYSTLAELRPIVRGILWRGGC